MLYKDALLREIDSRKSFFSDPCFRSAPNTLYIGGGTPSLAPLEFFEQLFSALGGASQFSELTVEVNPDDINRDYAAGLKGLGVNRISMGVQSFEDSHLKWMNRRHSAAQAREAFEILREAGFENISIDLIFGYNPHFGKDSSVDYDSLWRVWQRDIESALELAPEHISAYQMGIEDEALLGQKEQQGEYFEPDDEFCARQYRYLQETLSERGYNQYEISNFSLDGKESVHNSAYWRRVPYLGFGPGAHSFWGETRRWNKSDMGLYLKGTDYFEQETLSDEDVLVERVFLGLRCSQGLLYDGLELDKDKVAKFIADGSLVCTGDRLYLSPEKYFVSDSIIRELI